MEPTYCECAVKRRKTVMSMVLKVVLIIVVLSLMVSTVIFPWFAVLGVASAGFLIWYWPRFDVMWEYVYCDGQIDFDQIFGGEKRKTALRIEIEEADAIAPVDSERLAGYQNLPAKNFTSLTENAAVYGIAIKPEGRDDRILILFEPNEKMLDMMYAKCPRTVER